jgi:hypothetical protein
MKNMMLCLVSLIVLSASELYAEDQADHFPHTVQFVTVEQGVKLEGWTGAAMAPRSSFSPVPEIQGTTSTTSLRSSPASIMSMALPEKAPVRRANHFRQTVTIQRTTSEMTFSPC